MVTFLSPSYATDAKRKANLLELYGMPEFYLYFGVGAIEKRKNLDCPTYIWKQELIPAVASFLQEN